MKSEKHLSFWQLAFKIAESCSHVQVLIPIEVSL